MCAYLDKEAPTVVWSIMTNPVPGFPFPPSVSFLFFHRLFWWIWSSISEKPFYFAWKIGIKNSAKLPCFNILPFSFHGKNALVFYIKNSAKSRCVDFDLNYDNSIFWLFHFVKTAHSAHFYVCSLSFLCWFMWYVSYQNLCKIFFVANYWIAFGASFSSLRWSMWSNHLTNGPDSGSDMSSVWE